jgi:putative tryptophan/tyrosine transport system substrate-binding protein
MRRLELIALIVAGATTWPLSLSAQRLPTPVIGVLSSASAGMRDGDQFAAFDRGLKEASFVDGDNVKIEYRWANDNYARLPVLAKELVDLKVAVIVAAGGQVSALAAHNATKDIPIVFTTVADPVKSGLVASLNKPGGNATGTAGLTSELDPKRLELLHEFKPAASVFGVLVNPLRPGLEGQKKTLQVAADRMKLQLVFQDASTAQQVDTAFQILAEQKVHALIVTADPFFNSRRDQVVALAARYAMPAIYQWREFVVAGGLISYGPSITDAYHQAGVNAGRILKGAKPADIAVMQPTKFETAINLKTAVTLGLTLTRIMRARANEIIE